MKSALRKTAFREIKGTISRFLSIFGIVAVGVGFFSGVKAAAPDMRMTADKFMDESGLMDFRLVSTYGFDENDIDALREIDGAEVYPSYYTDLIVSCEGRPSAAGRIYSLSSFLDTANKITLVEGRMPENKNECIVSSSKMKGGPELGSRITLADDKGETPDDMLSVSEYTIVGKALLPMYIDKTSRGSTSVGNGSIESVYYVPEENFCVEYNTEVYVRFPELDKYVCYDDDYKDRIDELTDVIEAVGDRREVERYDDIMDEANEKLADGEKELADAEKEANEKIADGEKEISDAKQKLADAEKDIEKGEKELEDAKKKLADAEKEIADGEKEIADNEKKIEDGKKELEDAEKELADKEAEYEEEIAKAEKKLDDAEKEIADNEKKLNDGEKEYNDGLTEYNDGLEKFNEGKKQYEDGLKQYNDGLEQWNSGNEEYESNLSEFNEKKDEFEKSYEEFTDNETTLAETKTQLDEAKAGLDLMAQYYGEDYPEYVIGMKQYNEGLAQYEAGSALLEASRPQIEAAKTAIDEGQAKLDEAKAQLDSSKEILDSSKTELDEAKTTLDENEKLLTDSKKKLDDAKAEIDDGKKQLEDGKKELEDGKKELEDKKAEAEQKFADAHKEIDDAKAELLDGEQKIADAKIKLEDGKKDYAQGLIDLADGEETLANGKKDYEQGVIDVADGEKELADGKAEADEKIADAKEKLADARKDIEELDKPKWYVFTRDDNPGYSEYGENAQRINNIASVFPVFFIVVAILVCLTTMSRMVEEQRVQIGTLKALGYSNGDIIFKYMFYALSATFTGSVFGCIVGMKLFPFVIITAYGIMYDLPGMVLDIDVVTAVFATIMFVLAIGVTVFFTARSALAEQSAQLMRPKAPKIGKRILLERITPLWSRFNFSSKVTSRNLFRYKRKMLMTVIGISGCTALLLTGFALYDSINDIISKQYGELQHYEGLTVYDYENYPDAEKSAEEVLSKYGDSVRVYQKLVTVSANGKNVEAYIAVPSDPQIFTEYITMRDRLTRVPCELVDGNVYIDEKTSLLLKGVTSGDTIELSKSDTEKADVTLTGTFENYPNHYIYMTSATYKDIFGEEPAFNAFYFRHNLGADGENGLAEELLAIDGMLTVSFNTNNIENFSRMLDSLNMVIWVIILSAGLLAFIVMYNLTNINITERIREIATLKVLGFYDGEVDSYIFRENIILSVIGTAAGLVLGIFLANFVITTAEVDLVMFGRNIYPLSFVYAAIATVAFSALVTIAMHKRLKNIDMIEALKSVE